MRKGYSNDTSLRNLILAMFWHATLTGATSVGYFTTSF